MAATERIELQWKMVDDGNREVAYDTTATNTDWSGGESGSRRKPITTKEAADRWATGRGFSPSTSTSETYHVKLSSGFRPTWTAVVRLTFVALVRINAD